MADWVIVVDDDVTNLKMAGHILSRNGMRVSALKSGQALLDYLADKGSPDLILLDVMMPGMDGFETLRKLREREDGREETPVIFLTADESEATETTGLTLGAMDFIKKPFIPDVLTLRVRHIIDLNHLQRDLTSEVEKKTRENEALFLHVVQALADAIDAKDTYTNGHSGRVASYAREIARRCGFSNRRVKDIYMMGLLHDVGKIGIPDAIINKPQKLTPEEFDVIKTHTVMGARILKNIYEMPALVTGARWHHERYDGGGYPDGLSREDIPEEARIISVADAYDAMSSRRSYRDVLPQEAVLRELRNGRGTQFDPTFADVMIDMINEDAAYQMRES
ncbi:MAG: response regulator [Oscillospiraceae bacterium]|nr:response regulator [Oscillospiraceae bacterium]